MALTKRQRQVYDYIAGFVQKNGYSPSFEEIGEGMGLSSLATVHKHISNLEKKGLLRRDYNRSRSLDVLPPRGKLKQAMQAAASVANLSAAKAAAASLALPLVGRIAAGRPVETLENQETISLHDVTRSRDVFVLEVRGDSMQEEHIVDGDYVLVEKIKTARNGEIVVALADRLAILGENGQPGAAATGQRPDATHHGPRRCGADPGTSRWRAEKVLTEVFITEAKRKPRILATDKHGFQKEVSVLRKTKKSSRRITAALRLHDHNRDSSPVARNDNLKNYSMD